MDEFMLNIWNFMLRQISKVEWPRLRAFTNGGLYYSLGEADHDFLRVMLKDNYFIILTRRNCHLTTWLIQILSWAVSHKPAHYVHVLMNVEGDLEGHMGYKLIEATNAGVHFTSFMHVFDCDSVCLLAPKDVAPEDWTKVLDYVKSSFGKEYDNLFDITTDKQVSCVELIYWGLRQLPDFQARFPKLIELLNKPHANLTPQMLYDTGELDIIYEVRR